MAEELVQLPPGMLRPGQTLSFALYDAQGHLLFARGQVLTNTPQARALINGGAWVMPQDTQDYRNQLAHKMDTLMLQGASLSEIAKAEQDFRYAGKAAPPKPNLTPREIWTDLITQTHQLLRQTDPPDFLARVTALREAVLRRLQTSPDGTLLYLVFENSQSFTEYSARHALLSLVLADLAAEKLSMPAAMREALQGAALTMNAGASSAHDRLAARAEAASEAERLALANHAREAAALLERQGIKDRLWLDAVRGHHDAEPGPLAGRSPGEALARVLRRVDQLGARLSPRRSRGALSGGAAARGVYFDETGQPDEAGAALIKAVGLYPPGSIVRLANGEVGVVAKRGFSANEPQVAVLVGKSGTPLTDPVLRDTRLAAQAVSASLAPTELRLHVNLDALLKL